MNDTITVELKHDELDVIGGTLLRMIGEWNSQCSYHQMQRDDARAALCSHQSERLCLVYERVMGRSPLAGFQPVREAWTTLGVQAEPADQLVLPDFDWQSKF